MGNKKIIYEGKDIILYMDNISSSKVVFSFTGYEGEPGKNLYGDGFIQKCGFSGVFFVSLQNHWWQTPELIKAINVANHHTKRHKIRVTYGQSMGGYGALLCARRLNSRAVVTAPQTTINPELASIGEIWLENIRRSPIIRDNVLDELVGIKSAAVIYDNKGASDVSHVKYVERRDRVVLYKIPYATHNIPAALNEMGLLSKAISGFFENENGFEERYFRRMIRENRGNSFTYLKRLGFFAQRSRNKWLYDYYKKCVVARILRKISEADFSYSRRANEIRFRVNSHVESFDERAQVFVSKGNDPQVVFRNVPENSASGILVFYSSSSSSGNLFYSRGSEERFSATDALNFKVEAGVNVVRFDTRREESGNARTIRFDPMSCEGFFSVLSISYNESNETGLVAI
ncbi:hypothetical protein [Burkholderia sp. JKS000303]|uniref:hypothetical protein n=1 Tax=Burkholderia sp. JKS000303 TaxID=1938747 RepID=UPI000C006601|nr:hypothetical protein [Burkholderia sp. JKS000303]PFH27062.1 hypothetical protein BX604_0777 [Burkholderia sp. JKS000303]